MKRRHLFMLSLALALFIAIMAPLFIFTTQEAQAQCGSQASSCKDCHETQGEMPVNNSGDWHTQHSFGDFCEFCHAGNVQAKDKDAAHTGLADPLGDVKASCQSCHPDDFMARAQGYATALGIELGEGGSSGGGAASSGGGDTASEAGGGDSGSKVVAPGAAALPGGEEIDFNILYEEKTSPPPSNKGNLILVGLIALTTLAFAALVFKLEDIPNRVARWYRENILVYQQQAADVDSSQVAMPSLGDLARGPDPAVPETIAVELQEHPELQQLWPFLQRSHPRTLQALLTLLQQNPFGEKAIQALARLDPQLLDAVRRLKKEDRMLLQALVEEL